VRVVKLSAIEDNCSDIIVFESFNTFVCSSSAVVNLLIDWDAFASLPVPLIVDNYSGEGELKGG